MKYINLIKKLTGLVAILIAQGVVSNLMAVNITTSGTVSGPVTYNELVTIVDNGNPNDTLIYIVDGDFSCLELTIQANTIMVVKGDLNVGDVNLNSVDFQVYGTLVVSGSLDVKGKNSLELNIETTGILAVGGSYNYTGKNGGASEDNDGQLYLSDPDDFDGTGNESGDLGDLIEAGVLPPDIEDEFVDNVDETLFSTATWNGGSTQWDSDGNWNNTDIPTSGDNVLLEAGKTFYPKFCGVSEYFMWNLELEANTELVIPEGSKVTVLGDITIHSSSTLKVEYTSANPSSFIVLGDVIDENGNPANITFEWSYDELHWFFIGHPISNPQMSVYRAIPNVNGNKYALYDYQDDGTLTNLAGDDTFEFNQDVSSGEKIRGFQLKVLNPATVISQTGMPNNQDTYSKQVVEGWQIIANPYPAYYQIPVGSADFEGTEKTVYLSDSKTNADKQYYTFNTDAGITTPSNSAGIITDGIIAPGQAFYIKGTNSAENIIMRKSNLVHATGVQLKSAPNKVEENVLRLKLSNELGLTDEAVIALFPNGDVALTNQDSEQMMYSGTDYSYIYSMLDDTKTVINVLPEALSDYEQQLGVKTKAGRQYLKIQGLDNLSAAYEVTLVDNLTGVSTQMTNSTIYEFTAEEGEDHKRFVLHFSAPKNEVATDVEDLEHADDAIKVYMQNGKLLAVECDWNDNETTLAVYAITGELVMSRAFNGRTFSHDLNVSSGIYIVKVSNATHSYQQKVFVK